MADVPLPLGSQTVPGVSYKLLASNNCNSELTLCLQTLSYNGSRPLLNSPSMDRAKKKTLLPTVLLLLHVYLLWQSSDSY
jgi:hypothetical protein